MLLTHVIPSSSTLGKPLYRNRECAAGGVSPRLRRWLYGIALWLAVLLFLFVHPLYA